MRILFLTQVLPYPLDAGPKIRAYYVLRHLAAWHEVTLLSFVRESEKPDRIEHLRGFCREVHTVLMHRSRARDALHLLCSLVTNQPFLIMRDSVRGIRERVQQLAAGGQFDVVHADQLWMAQYAVGLNGVKRVLDQHNAVYCIPQRLAQHEPNPLKRLLLELEWRKLARYEAEVCRQFDHVITVTEEDKQILSQFSIPNSQFTIIPICVDPSEIPVVERNPEVKNIISIGTMFWPPNVDGVLWFAREVFPLVRQQVPEARFYIVGKNPPKEVRRLRVARSKLRSNDQPSAISHQPIVVTGYVEDPTPYFADSAVFIVPLRAGGGMRVKILDAWARGIPIVSTTIGSEGIEVREGENILIADTPRDFAQAVVRAIRDKELAQRLAENGRRWVEEKYDWRIIYPKLDEVYDKVTKREH
jgi:glycosyltransferase involved in cell wall biosynthesis